MRKTTDKRRCFLFTCLTTRAVHVEIVPFVSANSCVMGVERFVYRWRTPAIIWSVNGTNFVGAERELRKNIEMWNNINSAAKLARRGLTDKILNTTFCLVEYELNARPLMPVSADPSDLGTITSFIIIVQHSSITVNGTPANSCGLTLFGRVGLKKAYRL